MYGFNSFVDFFQFSKKQIITTMVENDEVRLSILQLVDAQTELVKKWADTTTKLSKALITNTLGQK